MDDQSREIPQIPRETVRLAKAAFGERNFYILVGDRWENILKDVQAENLPRINKQAPVLTLALVTFFQFLEGLTDEQAADAARTRIEWKYALHMAVHAPAFFSDTLCLYRQWINSSTASQREFQKVVDHLVLIDPSLGMVPGQQQGMALVLKVCALNRLHVIRDVMSRMLQYLAAKYPDWLRRVALPHWYVSYPDHHSWPPRNPNGDLSGPILEAGVDMAYLLEAISRPDSAGIAAPGPAWELAQAWDQHFERNDTGGISVRQHCAFCTTRVLRGTMQTEMI